LTKPIANLQVCAVKKISRAQALPSFQLQLEQTQRRSAAATYNQFVTMSCNYFPGGRGMFGGKVGRSFP
jgi:hypothetical protein